MFFFYYILKHYPKVPDDPDVGHLELVESLDEHLVGVELDVEERRLLVHLEPLPHVHGVAEDLVTEDLGVLDLVYMKTKALK